MSCGTTGHEDGWGRDDFGQCRHAGGVAEGGRGKSFRWASGGRGRPVTWPGRVGRGSIGEGPGGGTARSVRWCGGWQMDWGSPMG
jgi:hypothetical protein